MIFVSLSQDSFEYQHWGIFSIECWNAIIIQGGCLRSASIHCGKSIMRKNRNFEISLKLMGTIRQKYFQDGAKILNFWFNVKFWAVFLVVDSVLIIFHTDWLKSNTTKTEHMTYWSFDFLKNSVSRVKI